MGTMLDVIMATVAGALIIITILATIFNIQETAYNVQIMLRLNTAANEIAEALDYYLGEIGYNIPTEIMGPVFTIATADEMQWRRLESFDTGVEISYHIQVEDKPSGWSIVLFENGVRRYDTEPHYLSHKNLFTYYDAKGNEIADPSAALGSIYACRVDLELIHPGWFKDPTSRLRYPLTFWRYFKNIYIKDFAL